MKHKTKVLFQLSFFITGLFVSIIVLFFMLNKHEEKRYVKIGIIDSYIPEDKLNIIDISSICYVEEKEYINKHGACILEIIKSECHNAQIYYASALNRENIGTIESIIKSIEWCIEHEVDIICMSFATIDNDKNLEDTISKAINNNILIVSSCINYSDTLCYPAMYDGVISVSDGTNDNAVIIIESDKKQLNIDGTTMEVKGTSYTGAYVCGYIAKQLAKGNKNLSSIIRKLND